VKVVLRPGIALATLVVILSQNGLRAATVTVEVQGVAASSPSGDKEKNIPASLEA